MTMSGSETGLINTASIGGMQKPPGVNSPPAVHNIGMSFSTDGTPVYQPISGNSLSYEQPGCSGVAGTNGGGGDGSASGGVVSSQGINMNMGGSDPQKRKRGRPRKYGPDGAMTLGLAIPPAATLPPATACLSQSAGAFSPPAPQSAPALVAGPPPGAGTTGAPSSTPSGKKARGRPPGSTNRKQHQQHQRQQRQLDTQGQLGIGFTPHVITVQAGEDVSSRIMSFSQHGPRAICILSANGAISNVTLRQAATSGGTVTYEGRFEILSLSGSFMLSESGGQRSRTGGLSISLAGPDGRVLGGGVGGLLIAASPVQVVVASFITEGQKELKPYPIENPSMPGKLTPGSGATGANSPPSRGTLSESSGGPGSPLNQSSGACNNSTQQIMHGMPWK